jgi:hypothetical protein
MQFAMYRRRSSLLQADNQRHPVIVHHPRNAEPRGPLLAAKVPSSPSFGGDAPAA